MLNKEIFGNGFVRFIAAPDGLLADQRLYIFDARGPCVASLTSAEVRALGQALREIEADMDREEAETLARLQAGDKPAAVVDLGFFGEWDEA